MGDGQGGEQFDGAIYGPADVVAFVRAWCASLPDTGRQLVLGVDRAHRLAGLAVRPDDGRAVGASELGLLAEELGVGSVVLVSAMVGPPRRPGRRELRDYVRLRHAAAREGVAVLDWVITSSQHWCSLRDGVLREAA